MNSNDYDGKSVVIGYHDKCVDGFTAAWAARRGLLRRDPESDVECVPLMHSDNVSEKILEAVDRLSDGSNLVAVVFVDFCPERRALDEIHYHPDVNDVLVLDHHDTSERKWLTSIAQEPAPIGVDVRFDMNRSGARMAWDFFNPGAPVPLLVQYVEDRDLWRKALPHHEEIIAILYSLDLSFDSWDMLAARNQTIEEMAVPGAAVLRMRNNIVKDLAAGALTCEIAGYRVPCVNSPNFRSELGNVLAQREGVPFSVVWYQYEPGKFGVSLRSERTNPAAVDVNKIAERFGGGGHKNAAGFTLPAPPLVLA